MQASAGLYDPEQHASLLQGLRKTHRPLAQLYAHKSTSGAEEEYILEPEVAGSLVSGQISIDRP